MTGDFGPVLTGDFSDITGRGMYWRTAEYWSPHNAFCLWAVSNLERA